MEEKRRLVKLSLKNPNVLKSFPKLKYIEFKAQIKGGKLT